MANVLSSNKGKLAVSITLIVVAVTLIAIFASRSAGTSGTIQPEVQQMKPSSRGGH